MGFAFFEVMLVKSRVCSEKEKSQNFCKTRNSKILRKKCKNFAKKFEIENKNANFLRKFI